MATITAHAAANTQLLPELAEIGPGTDFASFFFTGPADATPDRVEFFHSANPLHIVLHGGFSDLVIAGTFPASMTVTSLEVTKNSLPLYELAKTEFQLADLYDDASDNSALDTIPAEVFDSADKIVGSEEADVLFGFGDDDTIDGNKGNDEIDGGAGNDALSGGEGNDDVSGQAGDDTIDGGAGNDAFSGGEGSDDTSGQAGDDTIDGGAGNDTMTGGAGNDAYVVDNAGDVVDETGGSGIDHVLSSVGFNLSDAGHAKGAFENLTLTGATAINATGNALANVLSGNSGANILAGNLGNDFLIGGAGNDAFLFDTKPNKAANLDHIIDLVHKTDIVELDHDIFKKLDLGKLDHDAFFKSGHAKQAHDDDDRIVYNKSSGKLYYDKDGEGGHNAKLFAILDGSPDNISAKDFLIAA